MSKVLIAVRIGLRRGWHEFVIGLRSPQDQGFYLFMGLGALALLWFNRDMDLTGRVQPEPAPGDAYRRLLRVAGRGRVFSIDPFPRISERANTA